MVKTITNAEKVTKMAKNELVALIKCNMNERVANTVLRRYNFVAGLYNGFNGVTYIKTGKTYDLNEDKAVTAFTNINYILSVLNKNDLVRIINSRAFKNTYKAN